MARVHGRKTRVWVDGFNLTGDSTNLDVSLDDDVAEVHAFGEDRKRYINGRRDVVATQDGLYDNAGASAAETVLRARIGSSVVFGGNYGTARLDQGWGGTAAPMGAYSAVSPLAGAVTFSAEYRGPIHPIILLSDEGAVAGTPSSVDQSAGSNNGAVGILQCTGMDNNGTVRIEHSVDDAVWNTLIDFGNITSQTAVMIGASGTVRRYVRAALPNDGTLTSGYIGFRRL